MARVTFKISVLNANRLIYSGDVTSVCLAGEETEYEILPFHSPLMGVLKKGEILIDQRIVIPIEKGLVKFFNNECTIMADEKSSLAASEFSAKEFDKNATDEE